MTDATIITGDALELIPTLDDRSIRLVVTSPPYPGQYGCRMEAREWVGWCDRWFNALAPKMAENGVIVINVMLKRTRAGWFDRLVFDVAWPSVPGWHLLDIYIYGKQNPPPNGALTFCDPPGWEFVYILTNAVRPQDVTFNPVRKPYSPKSIRKDGRIHTGGGGRLGRNGPALQHPDGARQTTLMMLSMSADQNRPRAKGISFPRALPDRLIRQYSDPGDLVLDPFCGAGTVPKVAALLGRRAIGFEIDPDEADRARAWLAEPAQMELARPAANGKGANHE